MSGPVHFLRIFFVIFHDKDNTPAQIATNDTVIQATSTVFFFFLIEIMCIKMVFDIIHYFSITYKINNGSK